MCFSVPSLTKFRKIANGTDAGDQFPVAGMARHCQVIPSVPALLLLILRRGVQAPRDSTVVDVKLFEMADRSFH